jgi:hypothetical protein
MRLADFGAALLSGEESSVSRSADDAGAGEIKVRQRLEIKGRIYRRLLGEGQPPDAQALGPLRSGEIKDGLEPPGECRVDVVLQIAGQDDEAGIIVEALQQIADFEIGTAPKTGGKGVGRLLLGALARLRRLLPSATLILPTIRCVPPRTGLDRRSLAFGKILLSLINVRPTSQQIAGAVSYFERSVRWFTDRSQRRRQTYGEMVLTSR